MLELSRQSICQQYEQLAARHRTYNWFNYQPINLPGFESTLTRAGRCCFDRASALYGDLERRFGSQQLRIIDWGCNLGFFAFELAKKGHDVVGVDSNAEYVAICNYLARTNDFPIRPQFVQAFLNEASIDMFRTFDVALCFSVLHHLKKDRMRVLAHFAATYMNAFIELDGRDYGWHDLFPFYYFLDEIIETNDRYGSGTRTRKTWYCSNHVKHDSYSNLKTQNLLGGRAVFKRCFGDRRSVVKREASGCGHTWIITDLATETANYRRWGGTDFFVRIIGAGTTDRHRWVEVEYADATAKPNEGEIDQFFKYLENNRLFLLDISADSFLFTREGLKVVDLESLFVVESTIPALINTVSRRPMLSLDTYEKQRSYIKHRVLR